MKAVVDAFNQEKALGGAFSVIGQLRRLIVYSTTMGSLVFSPNFYIAAAAAGQRSPAARAPVHTLAGTKFCLKFYKFYEALCGRKPEKTPH